MKVKVKLLSILILSCVLFGCGISSTVVKINNSSVDADLKKIYLSFESDYLLNKPDSVKLWLRDDAVLIQTLHVPGMGSDSLNISKLQLINSMKTMKTTRAMPISKYENINIMHYSYDIFCATSHTTNQVNIKGKKYSKKEMQNVCFKNNGNIFHVLHQKIDVFYSEI